MSQDAIVYLSAIIAPVVLSVVLFAFVRGRRRARLPASWGTLVAGNVIVLIWCLSVVFLIGETHFRFGQDATDSFSQTRRSQRWFERHFQRNNASFRDSIDYSFRLSPGRKRISFLGDSFTAGHGIANVEHRFANRIRQRCRGKWEVHVLAEIGRDTGAEIKLIEDLRREGYQFDTVVLVYCLNDINDLVSSLESTAETAAPDRKPPYLVEHSFLINTLFFRLKARLDPNVSRYYDSVRAAYQGRAWAQQRERLRRMKDLVEAAGGRLIVVLFPFVHSLGPHSEYRPIHEILGQFWSEIGVPCLDLLPVLEPDSDEMLTVSVYDAHPNEHAHELASQAIFEWLRLVVD